ncbi:hypothetical protein CRI93_04440 [Longimonas halophila]|uniref:HEPN domain-containing protein n=1 Tax=Longimonas halophila TaxID=1469170 RepID=A0A2H3NR56_9BACT|nr:hypothetical protein CRI93_04440 [Longimonas halophila]
MSQISTYEWLDSASRRLGDARLLVAHDRPETALSNVYFALFYACKALLLHKDHDYKTHSSVIGNIGRFSSYRTRLDTGLPAQLQTERARCDYELVSYPRAYVERRVREAQSFIEASQAIVQ